MRSKHNKKRNTAFLYESLVREMTKAILEGQEKRKTQIFKIIKKYFKKNTALKQELELYKTLLENTGLEPSLAKQIFEETKRQYIHLNRKHNVHYEQDELIRTINKDLGHHVFQNFVPNYKNLATIYQIFNVKSAPKKQVMLENHILESLSQKKLIKEQQKYENPVGELAFKTFVKKFNEVYGAKLLKEQKELIKHYIASLADNGLELRVYLNEELGRIKQHLNDSLEVKEVKENQDIFEKTKETIKLVEAFSNMPVCDEMLVEVLKIQQLIAEIFS